MPNQLENITDIIFISQIEFYAYHGASDEEQYVGHRYAVDVELHFDTRLAGQSDNLTDTVNYSKVAKRLVASASARQFRLLERLAQYLIEIIFEEFPVDAVRLRVKKIRPPMNVIAEAVGVEIYRIRPK